MSKTRIKTPTTTIHTREEMERLVGDIARLRVREQKLTAEMNQRINEVRQDYDATLGTIAEELKGKGAIARDWAEAHPAEFGKAKSIAMTHGDVGWRINPPSLKTVSGWTWDRVLEKLRTVPNFCLTYIRSKEEVDKAGLLADRNELGAEVLRSVGVRVVQDEEFYIEPRIETPEARLQEAA